MKKKFLSLLLASLMLGGTLSGCGSTTASTDTADAPTGKKTAVVLNEVAHSIFYAPMYVAIEEGYFAQEGIDLTLVTGFGADKTMTALLTGEADPIDTRALEAALRERVKPQFVTMNLQALQLGAEAARSK